MDSNPLQICNGLSAGTKVSAYLVHDEYSGVQYCTHVIVKCLKLCSGAVPLIILAYVTGSGHLSDRSREHGWTLLVHLFQSFSGAPYGARYVQKHWQAGPRNRMTGEVLPPLFTLLLFTPHALTPSRPRAPAPPRPRDTGEALAKRSPDPPPGASYPPAGGPSSANLASIVTQH
jgi:hypothetical protein